MADQQRHLPFRQAVSGKDDIALVFPVGIINNKDAVAALQRTQRSPHALFGGTESVKLGKRRRRDGLMHV